MVFSWRDPAKAPPLLNSALKFVGGVLDLLYISCVLWSKVSKNVFEDAIKHCSKIIFLFVADLGGCKHKRMHCVHCVLIIPHFLEHKMKPTTHVTFVVSSTTQSEHSA